MSGGDEKHGLDLRLPWGRPEPSAPSPRAEPEVKGPEPVPLLPPTQAPPTPTPGPVGADRTASALESVERRLAALEVTVLDRLGRLDERIHLVGAALPKLATRIEGDLAAHQVATVKAVGQVPGVLVGPLEERLNTVADDLVQLLDRLEFLLRASLTTTMPGSKGGGLPAVDPGPTTGR